MVKDLFINPASYDIECKIVEKDFEKGVATIELDLNATDSDNNNTLGTVDANDALKLSKWFADLHKALK